MFEKQKQLSTIEANRSRLVTKVRWVVEVLNGRLKQYKHIGNIVRNTTLPNIMDDIKIAAAIINSKYTPLVADNDNIEIAEEMLSRINNPNTLIDIVEKNNYERKRTIFKKIDS
jgi:hypothetical protein